jgi:hypothetical protein
MPCAHRALRLFRLINDRSVQRSRRWGALRSEIKEEAAGRGTFAEKGTSSAGAHPETAASPNKPLNQTESQTKLETIDMKTSPLALLNDPTLLKTDALIAGEWIRGKSRFDVNDPATGQKLVDVANLTRADAAQAIAAANRALAAWRGKTGKERSIVLRKWFDLLVANTEDLGRLMTAEQGKPFAEAKGEVAYGASFIEWFAEEAKRVNGEVLPQFDNNRRLLVMKQAIGVCAAITPWNFPLAMITRKVAPALAAGCTVVIKPAELTPLTALAAAELAVRAGIPAGVLNVLTADSQNSIAVGKELCESDVVRHLSFTGSTEVGRILMSQCAPTVKKLSLELGGNAPFLVFDDADVDSAVEGAMASKYRNAGQTCVCANRLYVQDGIYDSFVEKFAAKVKALKDRSSKMRPSTRCSGTSTTRLPRAASCWPAATRSRGSSSSPRSLPRPRPTCCARRRKRLAPLRRCSASRPNRTPSTRRTTPSSVWRATSTPATWAASSAWRRRWSTAWSASMPA